MEKKQKKEYVQIIILSIFIVMFALSIIFTSSISKFLNNILYKANIKVSSDDLVVHFIDVGQGDAIALRFPNEKIMLIDSGPKNSQNYLVEYLKSNVVENDLVIDYLLLTHPDTDHSGGMSAVFEEFDVRCFYRPNIASSSENKTDFAYVSTLIEYDEVMIKAKKEHKLQENIINQNYEFYIGEAFIQIFAPLKIYRTTNEMSPIVKVTYLNKSFLFTGDVQEDSESDMLKEYGILLDADVLKVAHHGSDTSTSKEFIQVVTPSYAVICVGYNSYGHPNFSTITNLQSAGIQVLTTKENAVRFVCGHDMFGILNEKFTYSYEFVDWWIIALIIDLVLVAGLIKLIIKVIKLTKQENQIQN